jgi:multicomponent K+:H+ antiporter subunit G
MNGAAADLPLWAALLVALFVLSGAAITLVGAIGLLRFKTFYERVHAPTLGASLGTVGVLAASIVFFSVTQSRLAVHEVLIIMFVTLTTPVTLMLLTRSAIYRDRTEGQSGVPEAKELFEP